jgi:hypothetical protein
MTKIQKIFINKNKICKTKNFYYFSSLIEKYIKIVDNEIKKKKKIMLYLKYHH